MTHCHQKMISFVVLNNEPQMKNRSLMMAYKTFVLCVFSVHTWLSSSVFFAYSSTCCTHTFVCLPQWVLEIELHHSGCFPLYCPLDLKMDCSCISFCAGQVELGVSPVYTPSFISRTSAKPPQAQMVSSLPWSRGFSFQCGLHRFLWPDVHLSSWTTTSWFMQFTCFKNYSVKIVKVALHCLILENPS